MKKLPDYAASELDRLSREVEQLEAEIERKNEQRREIINRYSMNREGA